MGERSKTHHYNPQFILRGFALDGAVSTVDLLEHTTYTQSIRKAAAENDYNTVLVDGTKSDLAERAIANEVEGPASAILAKISSGGWIENDEERAVVARLLALQYVRVPRAREQNNAMADQLMKLELACGGPAQMREVLEGLQGGPVTDEAVRAAWASVRDFEDWTMALSKDHHVVDMIGLAEESAPGLFGGYDWAVMRWQRKHLLTSDAPLLLVRDPDTPLHLGVGLWTAGSIFFAIDRSTALVLINRAREHHLDGIELPPTAAVAREMNQRAVLSAQRRFYHHPDDSLADLLGENFKLPTPSPISYEDEHTRKLKKSLRAMAEWHFENPDQPHPMSRNQPGAPESGARPWSPNAS